MYRLRLTVPLVGICLTLAACSAPAVGDAPEAPHAPSASRWNPTADQAALDRYVALERTSLPSLLAGSDGLYSSIDVDPQFYGVSYTYVYTYAHAGGSSLDQLHAKVELQSAANRSIFPLMEKVGVRRGASLKFSYLNPDGSTVWSSGFIFDTRDRD